MVSDTTFAKISVRHSGNVVDRVIEGAATVVRDLPAKARNHMIRVALRQVLESAGIDVVPLSVAALRKIADRLS